MKIFRLDYWENMDKIPTEWRISLNRWRKAIRNEELPDQALIDEWVEKLAAILRPDGHEQELLDLVNEKGMSQSPSLLAPRWLCHFIGLRHGCSHLVLRYRRTRAEYIWVLQVRSWEKSDSPGHIDVSVGGHILAGDSPMQTIRREMREELGITLSALNSDLQFCGSYDSYAEWPEQYFYNAEFRYVYTGELSGLSKLHFRDNEVVGIYLCPESELSLLLSQNILPLADALKRLDRIEGMLP